MRKFVCLLAVILTIAIPSLATAREPLSPTTLQAAYESAKAEAGYDRFLRLDTGRVYTGGLLIGPTWDDDRTTFNDDELGLDVMIEGNGAVLDLQGQMICVSFCDNRLDIQDCIILNGEVRFRGDNAPGVDRIPEGSVTYCTFYQPHDYAVRLQGAGAGVTCARNIVVNAVDTGQDGLIWSGITGTNLPTGLAFGLSVQTGSYGVPDLHDNWTWFRDSTHNADPLRHFGFL